MKLVTTCTRLCGVLLVTSLGANAAVAQSAAGTRDGSRPVLNPIVPPAEFHRAVERGTRTNTGQPGPEYWQQWADYRLSARLDPESKRLEGSVAIRYHNRSPDSLPVLFLHLHQNLHAEGAIRNRRADVTGGVELTRVVVDGAEVQSDSSYLIRNTIMGVRLPSALQPGEVANLEIDWAVTVPQSGVGRMGWSRDNLFFVAYWYPQMAVYDDVVGWQLDPYLGNSEFYAGYGNYDLTVELPAGWIVQGTGQLLNDEEVLPAHVRMRLAHAASSDDVVHVVTEEDILTRLATQPGTGGTLTWRFHADSVRDVAFSATSESLWDAARTPVGDVNADGQKDYALVQTMYRVTAPKWQQAWRYAQHSIDFLSRFTGVPYPWPHMTAVEGAEIIGGGMEFPMLTLMGGYNQRSDSSLYYVTAHELGHMWVPMIVGIDERRYAWMDEGTTSFNENQARKEFFPGRDHDESDRRGYLELARIEGEGEMMRWTDYHYTDYARGVASYSKPSSVLAALRGLLGDETFLRAYRRYLATWSYKHPKPWDYFNTIENEVGEDLDWFWRSWYYETWTLDHAVDGIASTDDRHIVTVTDLGNVTMPARLAIMLESGEMIHREIPVEVWLSGKRTAQVEVKANSPIVRVQIDPDGVFPDVDRANNVWVRDSNSTNRP